MMETTLNVFNTTLYDRVTPNDVVLTSTRSIVAARMASTAGEFAATFGLKNSGTYNNQWMAVDYNQLMHQSKPGGTRTQTSQTGLLVVLEQAPGAVVVFDGSHHLQQQPGYFASYNIPSDPRIFKLLGYQEMVEKFGEIYTYAKAPRAQIFRRDATGVYNASALGSAMDKMRDLMRYNNWEHDPLSLGSPGNAIAARFDLVKNVSTASPTGGIDTKIVGRAGCQAGVYEAVSGPTWGAPGVPMFEWATSRFASMPHVGVPDAFNFTFTKFGAQY